jgi:Mn2+/Fe2+ NRAMP family transporter
MWCCVRWRGGCGRVVEGLGGNEVKPRSKPAILSLIGPGLLVAATGVGAGDLATASFAGSQLGTAILWAVVVGAFLKFALTEGLARWQLATGETLLEGAVHRLGRGVGWLFLPYLLLWSFFVGSALMSACGVTLHAMIPVFEDPSQGKVVFGMLSSVVGLTLVLTGGYRLFARVMSISIGVMFVTVLVTAALVWPSTSEVVRGLVLPSIPDLRDGGLTWTVALMGGVGGTLTILCYGYWLREEGRSGAQALRACRIDLGVAYTMTALFGIAMVIIGSTVEIEGSGSNLLVTLAERLAGPLGAPGKWVFLVGALGAVFSSLLGCWQALPYLFADVWALARQRPSVDALEAAIDTRSIPYRAYQLAIATVPMLGLFFGFREVQKVYAVVGALFIPMLALILLILNGRRAWVGALKNRGLTVAVLLITLIFFAWIGFARVSV